MQNVTHTEGQKKTRMVRLPEDIWEMARTKAFNEYTTISAVIEELLRFALKKKAA